MSNPTQQINIYVHETRNNVRVFRLPLASEMRPLTFWEILERYPRTFAIAGRLRELGELDLANRVLKNADLFD